ncbi:hypothetical protein [Vibrio scophthalmi]|uniref:Uncharacterized protein n=1 Tax=Vibrio scophthalmi TaxID=45658 RepID=A0A1E3WHF4_9VIBR|nr:hypothetical protein [Vibrio scophthalmi]ODS05223.1 hypothetical protein VSF3289_04364 [Vibrio scophthalmi]ODS12574.1 hypothetical protein VSF3289_02899 [Vibrio scophthalmi]
MDEDNFAQAKSIVDLPITDLIHAPCPDMVAYENYDPQKTRRAQFLIQKLREKHGLKKPEKKPAKPLNYRCTEQGCIER